MDQMEKVIGAEGAPLTTVACFAESINFIQEVLAKNLSTMRDSLRDGKTSQLIKYSNHSRDYVVLMDFAIGTMSVHDAKCSRSLFSIVFDPAILLAEKVA